MKNIHILPTDKPSSYVTNYMEQNMQWQNIYITSDEKIKEGDWHFNLALNLVEKTTSFHNGLLCEKIILTTDQDLIKFTSENDGVQAIDDEFLEWFVKNPSCEEVKVENVYKTASINFGNQFNYYKIIIPKEETKQECNGDILTCLNEKCICKHNKIMEKETLEDKRGYQKHSLTKTKGYKLWCNIIQRCYNPKNHSYKYYGEKGVVMEDYFKNSYENFINWIKGLANYENWLNSSELSLDRIDNTLGYIRGNIKFSTKTEQVENQNLRVDNKSGYKGVCYHKLNKKYGTTITINKSKVFLGYYDTALEAALVYDNYLLKNNLNRKTNL
jgi:hypothetical protein